MLFIATLVWGLSYSVQAMMKGDLGTFTIVMFKGIGGFVLLPVLFAQHKKISLQDYISGFLIGFCAFAGCVLQHAGLIVSTVSKAGFITSLYIIFVPLFEMISGKKMSRNIFISIALALVGLYFLCFTKEEAFNIGDLYLLGGSFFFAIQIMLIDRFTRKQDGLVLAYTSQLTVTVLSGIVALLTEKPQMSVISRNILPLLYLSLISGILAQSIQTVYQKEAGPTLSSLIMSFESVFAAFFGWLILHQHLTLREIFGSLLIFAAIMLAEKTEN